MAFETVNWIRRGGCIPDVRELKDALIKTTYSFKDDKLIIEPKEDIKEKLGYSPDHMDALLLTFALPVERASSDNPSHSIHQFEYNPLSRDRLT
jgi:phage terminase large subunit